jgi:Uma2 family endonuclease
MRPSDFSGVKVRNPQHLSRDEYHSMGAAGVLDDRTELLDGEICMMSPIGSRHARAVTHLQYALHDALGDSAVVWSQNPIALDESSEPQPDIAVMKPRDDDYGDSVPAASDVLLVIEVADTTLALDRGQKLALYARSRIPEYWVVDLAGRAVFVHREPAGDEYGHILRLEASRADSVSPQAFANCKLSLANLFS